MSSDKNQSVSQLPLDLSVEVSTGREDLIESPANEMAIALIDAWPDWPGSLTVIAGPIGSGKSHIAKVWANQAQAVTVQSSELANRLDEILDAVTQGFSVLVEDANAETVEENALFHLINAVRQNQTFCLITSRSWPLEWNVKLPDLKSRLKAAQVVELQEPDEFLLQAVIMKLFADRQLMVDEKVISYCTMRMERSLEAAGRLVEAMDEEALARKSGITKAVAARALTRLGMA